MDETRYLNALTVENEEGEPLYQMPLYNSDGECFQQISVIATEQDGTMLIIQDPYPSEGEKLRWRFPTRLVVRRQGVPYDNKKEAMSCLLWSTGLKADLLVEKDVFANEEKIWSLWTAVVPDIRKLCGKYIPPTNMRYRFVNMAEWIELWNTDNFDRRGHFFRNTMTFALAEFIRDLNKSILPELDSKY